MKKYTKVLAAAVLAASIGTAAFGANEKTPLQDINTYWGKAAVQYFYDHQYVSGTNGKFLPNQDITREGIAAIIDNILGNDGTAPAVSFTDVKGRWSARAVASMVDKQIMQGYSDNTFKPAQRISRQEFAVIAYNFMTYKGIPVAAEKPSVPFKDEGKIEPWAKEAVDAMAASGYMTGSQNVFNPTQAVTRGEAVNVLYRILMAEHKPQGETAGSAAGTAAAANAPADGADAAQQSTPEETSVETQVFKDITDVYGSIKKFADDGIMYWQGDQLHVGIKTRANKEKLENVLAMDKNISSQVVYIQTAKYSYNDYKKMMEQARKVYLATEATGATAQVDVDYLNEKVVLTVASISDETRDNLNKALGGALRIVVQ